MKMRQWSQTKELETMNIKLPHSTPLWSIWFECLSPLPYLIKFSNLPPLREDITLIVTDEQAYGWAYFLDGKVLQDFVQAVTCCLRW